MNVIHIRQFPATQNPFPSHHLIHNIFLQIIFVTVTEVSTSNEKWWRNPTARCTIPDYQHPACTAWPRGRRCIGRVRCPSRTTGPCRGRSRFRRSSSSREPWPKPVKICRRHAQEDRVKIPEAAVMRYININNYRDSLAELTKFSKICLLHST